MIRTTLEAWPTRRWVAVLALAPLLATAFVTTAGVPPGDPSVGWWALTGLAAVLSAGVLGSYVPQGGLRPDVGCAPCAVMPVATVIGAMFAVNNYGPAVSGPALAAAITLFGLTQRLGAVTSCDVPADPHATDAEETAGSGQPR